MVKKIMMTMPMMMNEGEARRRDAGFLDGGIGGTRLSLAFTISQDLNLFQPLSNHKIEMKMLKNCQKKSGPLPPTIKPSLVRERNRIFSLKINILFFHNLARATAEVKKK